MKLYIVTGSSRGMGAALAEQLLAPDHFVLGIARRAGPALNESWTADLSEPAAVAQRLQNWLQDRDARRFDEVVLVNNAATVTDPGPIEVLDLLQLSNSLRVGLEAVVLLSAAFLAGTRGWSAKKKILNISSGLGRRPMAGAAPYCAVKAGMDHFSRALALDEAQHENGAQVVSLAPGIIDTDMQVQLRGADPKRFPEQANFAAYKDQGALATPKQAAERLVAYLNRIDFGSNPVADVRG